MAVSLETATVLSKDGVIGSPGGGFNVNKSGSAECYAEYSSALREIAPNYTSDILAELPNLQTVFIEVQTHSEVYAIVAAAGQNIAASPRSYM